MRRLAILFCLLINYSASRAEAPGPHLNGLTYQVFVDTLVRLAPKVDLFGDVWKRDPEAIFYAGTTRDYAYWLLREFANARTPLEVKRIQDDLLHREHIEIRDFVMRESDVDIITRRVLKIREKDYAVHHIDYINPSRLDPGSRFGQTEINQGYIPVEKIALGQDGFVPLPQFGDGLAEVFSGNLTIHFTPPNVFYATHYAQLRLNHPILLALRLLRLLAADEYNRFGKGVPRRSIDELISIEDQRRIDEIVTGCLERDELSSYLDQEKFERWLNGTIRKAYRSYSNNTLANELMRRFRINELSQHYAKVKFVNNYLFAKAWNQDLVEENIKKYNVDVAKFYVPAETAFPGLKAYHGAGSEENFNGIVYQGAIPSTFGSAGPGHYVVSEKEKWFARNWNGSGKNVVEEIISSEAKVVNLKDHESMKIFLAFLRDQAGRGVMSLENDYDRFAEAFGIDILEYPYSTRAFVIKNSTIIESMNGAYKKILTYAKAAELVTSIQRPEELTQFLKSLAKSRMSFGEKRLVLKKLRVPLYSESVVGAKLLKRQEATSALIVIHSILDKFRTPTLYRVARSQMRWREYILLLELSEEIFEPGNLAADVFVQILNELKSADEVEAVLPSVLRRLNEPEILQFYLKLLSAKGEPRKGALLGIINFHNTKFEVPWSDDLAVNAGMLNLGRLQETEKFWFALSWLKSGFRTQEASEALAQALIELKVEVQDESFKLTGADGLVLDSANLNYPRQAKLMQSLREGLKVVAATNRSAVVLRRAFDLIPVIKFSSVEVEQIFRAIDLKSTLASESLETRQALVRGGTQAIAQVIKHAPLGNDQGARQELKRRLRSNLELQPEITLEFYSDPEFKALYPLIDVLKLRITDIDLVRKNLKSSAPLVRLLSALALLRSGQDATGALGTYVDIVESVKFDGDRVALDKTVKLSVEEYVLINRAMLVAAAEAKTLNAPELARVVRLRALPEMYEDSELSLEFESLKVLTLLNQKNDHPGQAQTELGKTILNNKAPRGTRLAAARAMSFIEAGNSEKAQLELLLKVRYRREHSRFWIFKGDFNADDFFSENDHFIFHIFRLMRSNDPEFIEYLYRQTQFGYGFRMAPTQIAATILDLDLKDERFLQFLTNQLMKTGAKNMQLYFETLVRVFPAHLKEILLSVYTVRNIGTVLNDYLKILLQQIERDSSFFTGLREARQKRTIPLKQQIAIEGLYLDDWLKLKWEARSKTCAHDLERIAN